MAIDGVGFLGESFFTVSASRHECCQLAGHALEAQQCKHTLRVRAICLPSPHRPCAHVQNGLPLVQCICRAHTTKHLTVDHLLLLLLLLLYAGGPSSKRLRSATPDPSLRLLGLVSSPASGSASPSQGAPGSSASPSSAAAGAAGTPGGRSMEVMATPAASTILKTLEALDKVRGTGGWGGWAASKPGQWAPPCADARMLPMTGYAGDRFGWLLEEVCSQVRKYRW